MFVFRHCVRSTSLRVHLYEEKDKNKAKNASDFTASPMADFNVPSEWCTAIGMEVMENTGKEIVKLLTDSGNVKSIHVEIISDLVQRDVDSSFALAKGIMAVQTNDTRIGGLFDLTYDQTLFHPLNASFCEVMYSPTRFQSDVKERLRTVAPPNLTLDDAFQLLHTLGGTGIAGPLHSQPIENLTLVEDEKQELKIQGGLNVLKLFAEAMFYSRASGIDPPFLPSAPIQDVFQLLAWVHWSRSVLSVNNVHAATEGAPLAHAILERLSQKGTEQYDVKATFFVGHDSTLDSIATAFGLRWQVRPPYYQSSDFIATPPNSALHFAADDNDTVEIQFLYPTFLNGTGNSWNLVKNDNLEYIPITFDPPIENAKIGNSSTLLLGYNGRSGLENLKERAQSVLSTFPGSLECYNTLNSMDNTTQLCSWSPTVSCVTVTGAAVIIVVVLFVLLVCWRQCRRRNKQHHSQVKESDLEDYDIVDSNNMELV